jgi:hypothetical protein
MKNEREGNAATRDVKKAQTTDLSLVGVEDEVEVERLQKNRRGAASRRVVEGSR